MIMYSDIITGDEVISDSYPMQEIDGIAYEINCRKITIGAETFDIGANASAQDPQDDAATDDQQPTQVIDIVHHFNLQQTSFDKKGYLAQLKGYMKAVKEALKAKGADEKEIKDFEAKASGFAKVVGGFKEYEFFVTESMNPDGMVVLLNYREDGVTPYVTLWKHGLAEMKV